MRRSLQTHPAGSAAPPANEIPRKTIPRRLRRLPMRRGRAGWQPAGMEKNEMTTCLYLPFFLRKSVQCRDIYLVGLPDASVHAQQLQCVAIARRERRTADDFDRRLHLVVRPAQDVV